MILRADSISLWLRIRWSCLLFLLAASIQLTGATALAQALDARVASVQGTALRRNNQRAFILARGDSLNPGDEIDTRGGGRVVIELTDGSVVVVKPNSYSVNSPTASILVRGTEFDVAVEPSGDTTVVVYEGLVEVRSLSDPRRSTLLSKGGGALVKANEDIQLFTPGSGNRLDEKGARNDDADEKGARNDDADNANANMDADTDDKAGVKANANANANGKANGKANGNAKAKRDDVGGGVEAAVKSAASRPDEGGLQRDDVTADAATSVRTYLANDYERYIDSMAGLSWSLPLRRFGALADSHFDSLDNPAYSTEITSIEGRVWLIPSFNKALGGDLRSGSADFPLSGNLISPFDSGLLAVGDFFIPLERVRMVIGGAVAVSTDRSQSLTVDPAPASLIRFFPKSGRISRHVAVSNETIAITGSLMAARRFGADGRTSVGVGMEWVSVGADLRGQTSLVNGARTLASEDLKTESQINRLRFRLGMTREFDGGHKLGLLYSHELANADDRDRSRLFNGLPLGLDSTRQEGRSSEVSFRLRGPFTRRLFYGLEGSLLWGESDGQIRRAVIADSTTRANVSSAVASFGLGFFLRRTTVLSGDFAFGLSRVRAERLEDATGDPVEDRRERERYISAHVGLQTDVWRQLFASASALVIGEANTTDLSLYPDLFGRRLTSLGLAEPGGRSLQNSTNLFSDFGVGRRLRPNLVAEYIFSINTGLGPPRHIFLLRYTFRREK